MALTGRFVVLLALGVIPIVLIGEPWGLTAWIFVLFLPPGRALALAASPRAVLISRDLPARVRLGETVRADAILANTGTRTIRGSVRDAWQPSAGAAVTKHAIVLPAGERRHLSPPLPPFGI